MQVITASDLEIGQKFRVLGHRVVYEYVVFACDLYVCFRANRKNLKALMFERNDDTPLVLV